MECFIVKESDVDLLSKTLVLRDEESHHAIRVLRMREGDKLIATSLNGFCYLLTLLRSEHISKNEWVAYCEIEKILQEHNEPHTDIQLIQGITQHQSKFEEIVEKVTELGVSSLVPIYSKRTEKKTVNHERIERIIKTACKQTSRARMPELYAAVSFEKSLEKAHSQGRKIILLHESASLENPLIKFFPNEKKVKVSLVIGPEGGFDEAEVLLASVKFNAVIASLGLRRLRAETAAITAVAIAMSNDIQ
jgi:16S rRNA (uracil1498-N3)-methyltransferase